MAKGPRYNVRYRRRREGKTDYKKRRGLVISRRTRLVIRASNKNLSAQLVEAKPEGDRVIASALSKELAKKYDWRGGTGNLSAAYLTGFLAGVRSLKQGVTDAILDLGLRRATPGSRLFSALKGALDAGLRIPCDKRVLPDESRIKGEHLSSYWKQIQSNPELKAKYFTLYAKKNLKPEQVGSHFEEAKQKIAKDLAVAVAQ